MSSDSKPTPDETTNAPPEWDENDRTVVHVAGREFTVDRIFLGGTVFYGCGILPLRSSFEKLAQDITLAQGPEWRGGV